MAVTSTRVVTLGFSGDVTYDQPISAANNVASSGEVIVATLASGANTITAPVVSGVVVSALTIIPPSGNTATMTLKGVTGDTGVPLHLTDPTSIAVSTTFTSLCITASTTLPGIRFVWS